MAGFDHTAASFVRDAGGNWKLDRDWTEHPPTESEVQALAVAVMVMGGLLREVVHHVAVGNLQVTDGLNGISHLSVVQVLRRVDQFMAPQPAAAPGNEVR